MYNVYILFHLLLFGHTPVHTRNLCAAFGGHLFMTQFHMVARVIGVLWAVVSLLLLNNFMIFGVKCIKKEKLNSDFLSLSDFLFLKLFCLCDRHQSASRLCFNKL